VIVNKLSIAQSYSRRYFETRLQVVDSAAALSFGEGQALSERDYGANILARS
jgi:hypothetical protein